MIKENPKLYANLGLKDFCDKMHKHLSDIDVTKIVHDVYSKMPEQDMVPAKAYEALVNGNVERVRVDHLENRTAAVVVVPYPPGIPVILCQERGSAPMQRRY